MTDLEQQTARAIRLERERADLKRTVIDLRGALEEVLKELRLECADPECLVCIERQKKIDNAKKLAGIPLIPEPKI